MMLETIARENINRLCRQAGLNNRVIAAQLQCTETAVSRVRAGTRSLSFDWIEKFAAVLDVDPDVLFERFRPDVRGEPIEIRCQGCGSLEVMRDAYAEWDRHRQRWVLQSVFDAGICDHCGDSTVLEEVLLKDLRGGRHECQNCGETHSREDLDPIQDVEERVAPGEPMPSGECPVCGSLCHPVEKELVNG